MAEEGGVVVVDKGRGPTSHDVVQTARRALGTRAVGHAGTLDPMATGVLVLAFEQGTKLVPWLTADDKEYDATITLGVETDSLDADGQVTAHAPVPPGITEAKVKAVLATMRGTILQRAPVVSAIKMGGEALHAKVRRGEAVEAPDREVVLHTAEVTRVAETEIDLHVVCGKGFYVRALARDVAKALGTIGHLTKLRRTRSGAFRVEDALPGETLAAAARGDDEAREVLAAKTRSLAQACAAMPQIVLDELAVTDAKHGRRVRIDMDVFESAPQGVPVALLDGTGHLVAIATRESGAFKILRGFL